MKVSRNGTLPFVPLTRFVHPVRLLLIHLLNVIALSVSPSTFGILPLIFPSKMVFIRIIWLFMSLKYLILFHVVDIMLTTFDFYKNFLWCSNLQRGSRRTSTGFLCRGEHPIKQKFVLKKLVAYGGGGRWGRGIKEFHRSLHQSPTSLCMPPLGYHFHEISWAACNERRILLHLGIKPRFSVPVSQCINY